MILDLKIGDKIMNTIKLKRERKIKYFTGNENEKHGLTNLKDAKKD
jgi:hypothetical protein